MDAIATINSSISIVKRLYEISKNIEEAEFRNLLADLSNELGDAKLEIAGLKEELAKLKQENAELKTARAPREKPKVKWGCYIFPPDENLYCSACYDTKGLKSLTHRVNSQHRSCPVCKATIFT